MDDLSYLLRKLRSHEVLTEDLDAAANKLEKLRNGLLEALEWNWMDDDAPQQLRDELTALAGSADSANGEPK